jgi:hypothetical protein
VLGRDAELVDDCDACQTDQNMLSLPQPGNIWWEFGSSRSKKSTPAQELMEDLHLAIPYEKQVREFQTPKVVMLSPKEL